MSYIIRKATDSDREAVTDIFNYFVENSFAAYPDKKFGYEIFDIFKGIAKGGSFYAVEFEGKITGFGFLKQYHSAAAFSGVSELTYFILPEYTGKGIGTELLNILISDAKNMGIRTVIADISSLNETSLNFHKKNGFVECGRFKDIGRKHGKEFDVVYMQKFI